MLNLIEIKDKVVVHVWRTLFQNGKVFIKEMFGKQNSTKYKDILSFFVVPEMESKYRKNYIFQQDNCPKIVSRNTKNYFDSKRNFPFQIATSFSGSELDGKCLEDNV